MTKYDKYAVLVKKKKNNRSSLVFFSLFGKDKRHCRLGPEALSLRQDAHVNFIAVPLMPALL